MSQLRHDRVIALLDNLAVLPTAINVPMRIMQMARDPKTPGLVDFAQVIMADAALSGKLLELANSAWFAPTHAVTKVSEALRMIGLKNLLPLLFGLSLGAVFNPAGIPEDEREALWHNALHKGALARQWAKIQGLEQTEEAFLAAVLQDIALPLMFSADRAAALELACLLDFPGEQRASREAHLYGADHAEFGRRIAQKLNLPEFYVVATATHHNADGGALPAEYAGLAPGLKLAAALPHGMSRLDESTVRRLEACSAGSEKRLSPGQLKQLILDTSTEMHALNAMLKPSQAGGPGAKGLLHGVADRIARCMFEAVGASSSTIAQLQSSQDEMEGRIEQLETQIIQSDYDDLSGVLKRKAFLERGEKVFQLAKHYKMGCAVGFADLDNFKSTNDTYGHDAGDHAILAFATALKKLMGNRGITGRCGGDEFFFILVYPATATQDQINAEISRGLADVTITVGTQIVPVSASVGLAWFGQSSASITIQQAVQRADELMYVAKRSNKGPLILPPGANPQPRLAG